MLEAIDCSYKAGGKSILSNVSLRLRPGVITALMGPNGAGKSTLLKILSGQLKPASGEVKLYNRPLSSYSAPQLARLRCMMSQNRGMSFPFLAQEIVMFGGHPRGDGDGDDSFSDAVDHMRRTETDHLARQVYNTLSGGETARVDLARILAQQTDILLLDEPTNHLDPRHQVSVLQLCRELADEGKAIGVCLHDLNLAANFCDEVLLLKNGHALAHGRALQVLNPDTLRLAYDIEFDLFQPYDGPVCIVPAVRQSCPGDTPLQPV